MTLSKTLACLLIAGLLVPADVSVVCAAVKSQQSTSDLLTEGLDDLLGPTPKPGAAPATPASPKPKPWAPDQKLIEDMLQQSLDGRDGVPMPGEDLGQPQQQPLERVQRGMTQATGLIGRLDKTGKTVQVQEQIVEDLDELIKQMEKQCSSCNSQCNKPSSSQQQSKRSQPKPGQQKPGQPKPGQAQQAQASQSKQQSTRELGQGSGESQQGRDADELMKEVWGHLPERLREQMMQSASGEFLPKYREEIEQYFQRLAEDEARAAAAVD